jgi:predicted dehydrogenase
VATSVTVSNPSSEDTRRISAWIADGAVGNVREVHNWSSRPFWPQGIPRPAGKMPVPAGLDWNMWLGPAPERPYHSAYLPFVWRGWYDFGCGSFGDMGCYSFAGIFKILNLPPPLAVECSTSEWLDDSYPKASIVHLDFPAANGHGPIRLSWYDGGIMPPRPAGLAPDAERLFKRNGEGIMYVGDKGYILAGFNGQRPRVFPENPKYPTPPEPPAGRTRTGGGGESNSVVEQWMRAIKGGPPSTADFASQVAPTESFLLGCLAQRVPNERYLWDSAQMRITNAEAPNKYLDPPYRRS